MSAQPTPVAPPVSVTAVRERVGAIVRREASSSPSRHVVVLGVDGIPYARALPAWSRARTERMRAVSPTTSSTSWLSSLSGMSAADHGVPGVVFALPGRGGELVNVYDYTGPLAPLDAGSDAGNVFSDAAQCGYVPLVLLGDLEPYPCSWRDLLLAHATCVPGHLFYGSADGAYEAPHPGDVCRKLERAIADVLEHANGRPHLVWCHVEIDRHVHRHGYDAHVLAFLEALDAAAVALTRRGAVVVAHADHGLTPTTHDAGIERCLERVQTAHGCTMGGAGRTRWLYTQPGTEAEVARDVRRQLPASVHVGGAGEIFAERTLSRSRIGEVVLIARGPEFVTFPGYRFDHGSCTDAELDVPFAAWRA